MKKRTNKNIIAIFVLLTYLLMIGINGLGNSLPINGKSTGDVSDAYTNIFAPAGITFSIWGLIYLLLFGFSIYQLIKRNKIYEDKLFKSISYWFIFSSIMNSLWIFAWHYNILWLSLVFMIGILVSLIKINMILRNKEFNNAGKLLIRIPFAVYFGWITVATIANVTTFLVAINWNRFGLSEVFWADTMILIGAIIGVLAILYYKSFSYGLVIIWAYLGIGFKHISPEFFNRQYPSVIVVVIISIMLVIIGEILMLKIKNRKLGGSNG